MTVTTLPAADLRLAHICRCTHPRSDHAGARNGGRCATCPPSPHGCGRFRRDRDEVHAELAVAAAVEPLHVAMNRWDKRRARSNKTARARKHGRFGVGPSDIGECRAAIGYREKPPPDLVPLPGDKKAAVLGTWAHEGFTSLQRSLYPWRKVKLKVHVPGFDEPGEVDAYDPFLARVIDLKTKGDYGWDYVVAFGPDDDDLDQTMIYGLGLEEAGFEVREVELVYLWRKTGETESFVRPYDRARALKAVGWLHNVLDSLANDVELPRDGKGPGVDPLCDRCPFVGDCWQVDVALFNRRSPQGWMLARDEPEIAAALVEYDEQRAIESAAKRIKGEIRPYFDGLEAARYGDVTLNWQKETTTEVPDLDKWAQVIEAELRAAAEEGRPPRFPEELPHPTKPHRTGGGIIIKRVRAAQLEAEAREAAAAASEAS